MKKFFDELNESTITGGYPDSDDTTGICTDDDLPPGTTVFGDKMVPVVVPNRLTGKTLKYVPAADLGQEWNYDEFAYSTSMGSHKSYSDTLNGLDKLLGDRAWKHTDHRKMRMQTDKWVARSSDTDGGVKQTAKTSDDKFSHMKLTKDGELSKTTDEPPVQTSYWREVIMKELDIMEKINGYLDEPEDIINEEIVDSSDRKTISKAIMSGKNTKIVVKSLDIQANITNYDNEIVITYPKNEDFTLTLVDIADALGMEFKLTKDGGKQAFRMIK